MKTTTMRTLGIVAISSVVALSSCKKPEAGFEANKTTIAVGEQVSFTDTEEERKNAVYYYDMGDGTTYSTRNPSHIYEKAGSYKVQQTINTTKNMEKRTGKSIHHSVDITVVGPTAAFSASNTSPAVGEGVNFANETTVQGEEGATVWYTWFVRNANNGVDYEISDGSGNYTDNNAVHTFNTAGSYIVTLKAQQGATVSYAEVTINVYGGDESDYLAASYAKMTGTWGVSTASTHSGTAYTSDNTANCYSSFNAGASSMARYKEVTIDGNGVITVRIDNPAAIEGNATPGGFSMTISLVDETYADVAGNWFYYENASPIGSDNGLYTYSITDSEIVLKRAEKGEVFRGGDTCPFTDDWTITLTK